MTAAEALDAGKAAVEANRPLTYDEFQAIHDATQAPTTDAITRGALRGLGEALQKQSDARARQQQERQLLEGLRENAEKARLRVEEWRALSPIHRALVQRGDPLLAKLIDQETQAASEPPGFWNPVGG